MRIAPAAEKKRGNEAATELKARYQQLVNNEIENLEGIIQKANELGGEQNIISKANKLLDDMEWQKKSLIMSYRFFYHHLDALNLINHDNS